MENKRGSCCWLTTAVLFLAASMLADTAPVILEVDATDAPRNLLHAKLHIPAAPGPLTLYYPKWIPGEHLPGGPINELADLTFTADGKPVNWRRDAEDMFAFHLDVPADAKAVDVALDFLLSAGGGGYSAGGSSTPRLLDLSWNQVLLYPRTAAPLQTEFDASLILPAGWKYGTALPVTAAVDGKIRFAPAPLGTLVDSPVITGEYFRTIELTPGRQPEHFLHLVAENPADLEIKPEDIARFTRLVQEANALFGVHHYRSYHFLATLNDQVAHFGLEHHESSDDRLVENFLTDEDARALAADLLPHEMVHSWNGKYRRPSGLATPDYQQPMQGELLWVYEGLTDYLGKVLAARSGLMTTTNFRATFALTAAMLDHRSGRTWRSLADTTVAAQLLYSSPGAGTSRRRGTDFYSEGDLIWLEADTIIRQQTDDKKSLDDFCRTFHGGQSGPPTIIPYGLDEVIQDLNETAPYDWRAFFQKRVYEIATHVPLGGLENGGWKLAYTNEVPAFLKMREGQRKYSDLSYSLGFTIGTDGGIGDVIPGSPADVAGLIQGMKLVAVNERGWSAKILRDAVNAGVTNHAPLDLLVENSGYYKTYPLVYHGGEKYPILVRDMTKPDRLGNILKPLTPEPATNSPAGK